MNYPAAPQIFDKLKDKKEFSILKSSIQNDKKNACLIFSYSILQKPAMENYTPRKIKKP